MSYILKFMNILFLGIISVFFWLILRFLNVKNNLIKAKKGVFRAGPTWMRRGTQGHVAAPRGPTLRLRGAYAAMWHIRNIYIYYYIVYNV